LRIAIDLNGRPTEINVGETEMLQSALRWKGGLSSVRSTCGIGVCGACTVLLAGRPVSSCLLLAPLADGHAISTVEGLPPDDPVVEAFVECNAFQCSYCTPGLVMAAKGLLAEHEHPTDEQIRERLSGNICRCGSYRAIVDAVKTASASAAPRRASPPP